ncbi:protein HID1 [Galendromus occidentalis]|uniref:Protein HID1 n=1 Tax=Galendromus occidentalis TaxID=34638 RepID=A0AAJ7WIV7_9ACAR|nr:protein HID1 [Galendromus occidentalis]
MGSSDSKLNFRKAVIQLTTRNQPIDVKDELFWEQLWTESVDSVQDIFALMPAGEVRALRDDAPTNLATLCYKAVEKLARAADTLLQVDSPREQQIVLNCVRLLTRLVPYIFEDPDWRGFFWSSLPGSSSIQGGGQGDGENESPSLAHTMLTSLCDLLFCPDFTVHSARPSGTSPDGPDEITDSCELIWEAGVGCAASPPRSARHDHNRTEILKLLLTLFSNTMYHPANDKTSNRWLDLFTSADNRHALPLFTSLLNTVCGFDPYSSLVPLNHLIFEDHREPLVEVCLQLLIVALDHEGTNNLFVNYLSRIHRDHDLEFVLKGFTRLLNNPLQSTYLPSKKIQFHQELLVLFWKTCDHNRKFLFFVLKSSEVLNILVPTLYHLNEARADPSRVGLVHIGVFILLLLSGERNFGVRLNKPYAASVSMDVPVFSGTHADLLVLVFHRMITTGHARLQPLFDCLLTIIVNVSPYLKSLSMVASTKLLHLLEAFSTPWFLYSNPNNHHLVFFLLEIFNNIIQYQFDGNSNLVYTIIRKRNIFHLLANLPTDGGTIQKSVATGSKPSLSKQDSQMLSDQRVTGEESHIVTLAATPRIDKMTEKEEAHKMSIDMEGSAEGSESKETQGSDETEESEEKQKERAVKKQNSVSSQSSSRDQSEWRPTPDWVISWKQKLPLQTIMRLLQVLVPQVEKICIDKGLTDESEILKFLQHGTLVGLLPVPHPILIRKYQANAGTAIWFKTYMWGVIYLRNTDPPIWYDTGVQLFQIQTV